MQCTALLCASGIILTQHPTFMSKTSIALFEPPTSTMSWGKSQRQTHNYREYYTVVSTLSKDTGMEVINGGHCCDALS